MKHVLRLLLVGFLCNYTLYSQAYVEDHVATAHRIASDRKFVEAAAEMSKAIAIQPQDASLYIQRARFYRFANDDPNFQKDIEKALQLKPEDESVLTDVTRLLMDRGEREMCEQVLTITNAYISRHSQSDAAFDARFRAKTCIGDFVGAFNDVSMAAELNPQSLSHSSNRANLLSRLGDSELALELFKSLIDRLEAQLPRPVSPQTNSLPHIQLAGMYIQRSGIHEKRGDKASMMADLSRAVEILPHERSWRARATAYRKSGEYSKAIADLSLIIAEKKKEIADTDFLHGQLAIRQNFLSSLIAERAGMHVMLNEFKKAFEDYDECIRLTPEMRPVIEKRIAEAKQRQADFSRPIK